MFMILNTFGYYLTLHYLISTELLSASNLMLPISVYPLCICIIHNRIYIPYYSFVMRNSWLVYVDKIKFIYDNYLLNLRTVSDSSRFEG